MLNTGEKLRVCGRLSSGSFEPLTAGGPRGGITVGFSGRRRGSSSSSSSGRGAGGGGGARLGHWPISAFSKETGCEKSERLTDGQEMGTC